MSRPLAFDTSVVIPYLLRSEYADVFENALRRGMALLPAPAISELYAGTRSRGDKHDVDVIFQNIRQVDGILVPSEDDWALSGMCLARYIRLFGEIRPRDHLSDLLIAILASNAEAALVTANIADMLRWKNVLRSAGRRLILHHP